jgi:hypothetical protein
MTDIKRKSGLGRGLSALLDDIAAPPSVNAPGVIHMAVSDIAPNPNQPRRHFDESAMGELAASIRLHGVLQPILVRPHAGRHQIIAGERRWRASQIAGLHEIPVVIRDLDERQVAEIALIENVQRAALSGGKMRSVWACFDPLDHAASGFPFLSSPANLTIESTCRQIAMKPSRSPISHSVSREFLNDPGGGIRDKDVAGRRRDGEAVASGSPC